MYFLAIEMTRRRLASTISFFAWAASLLAFLNGADNAAELGNRQRRLFRNLGGLGTDTP